MSINPSVDFLAGTAAGISALFVGFPFDTVKVRFQTPEHAAKYRSTFHAFFTILRHEGLRGLYRGITSPLISSAPMNGLVFTSYRFFIKVQTGKENAVPSLAQITIAGGCTGLLSSLITTPTELIKIRQQAFVGSPNSSQLVPPGAREVALRIIRQHGIQGLYRGLGATAWRELGYGAYFATYEATLRFFSTPNSASDDHSSLISEANTAFATHSWPVLLFAGGSAGVMSWISTFPFDVIKTRIQSTEWKTDNPYRSTLSTIISSYKTEGVRVFFRGLAPTLIRAVPVNMVNFATFEAVVHALS